VWGENLAFRKLYRSTVKWEVLQITRRAVEELAPTIHPFLFKFHAMWDRQHRGNLFRVFTT